MSGKFCFRHGPVVSCWRIVNFSLIPTAASVLNVALFSVGCQWNSRNSPDTWLSSAELKPLIIRDGLIEQEPGNTMLICQCRWRSDNHVMIFLTYCSHWIRWDSLRCADRQPWLDQNKWSCDITNNWWWNATAWNWRTNSCLMCHQWFVECIASLLILLCKMPKNDFLS